MSKEQLSPFDFAPGKKVLDRFAILEASRQNDLAPTYAATDERGGAGGRECELVFFPPAIFDSAEQVEEFARNWESWTRVESPHVVRVREVLPIEGSCALLVTDRPPGHSLRDWMAENGHMEVAPALALGVQLAEGLVEIHSAGLVHGDVKPQTIYVEGPGASQVRLVGGGLTTGLWTAKGLGDRTALIGTPHYAPVEQFGGESPDEQSDVYNVATVLFELVTGVLPWAGNSFLEVFQAKLDRSAPSMAARAPGVSVPPAVERAIVHGLLADKKERYATAQDFLNGLRAVS